MDIASSLAKRIDALEKRVTRIERQSLFSGDKEEHVWMEALYQKAKELAAKHRHLSPVFLQKKLLIDFRRATTILRRLKKDDALV